MDAPKLSYLTYLGHVFTARVTPQDGWSAAHPRSATPRLHPCDLCFIPRVLCSLAIVLTAFVPCPVFVAGMSPPRAPLQTSPCVRNSVLLSLARRSSSAPRGYINSTLLSRVIALQGTLPASRQTPGKPPKRRFRSTCPLMHSRPFSLTHSGTQPAWLVFLAPALRPRDENIVSRSFYPVSSHGALPALRHGSEHDHHCDNSLISNANQKEHPHLFFWSRHPARHPGLRFPNTCPSPLFTRSGSNFIPTDPFERSRATFASG